MRIQSSFNPKSKKMLKTTKDQKLPLRERKIFDNSSLTSKQSTNKPISLEYVVETRTMIPNGFQFWNY